MVRLLTINIHKGFSALNKRFVLHELREAIRSTSADVVFLQEVVGKNSRKAIKHPAWPEIAHYEFLADSTWPYYAYGKNAVYPGGHHGNAILSRYPIKYYTNIDISTNRIEKRGLLYGVLDIPDCPVPLHCICVHLGLSFMSRRKQLGMLETFIHEKIPQEAPVVLAGDFNEWRGKKRGKYLVTLGMRDASLETRGKAARTFPSWLPILPLDRICIRGMEARHSRTHHKGIWSKLSDHAAFSTEVEMLTVGEQAIERAV